ncbi:hypothetical protein [Bacillus marinisedimentorum]|uniref:hypothetical protein n=1 Tax=Bacillus marinisedimentorum TaxID=1821260 RepID=UPI0007E22F1D|nr:hypothetical protein [Bacillus marinisedimentorum]
MKSFVNIILRLFLFFVLLAAVSYFILDLNNEEKIMGAAFVILLFLLAGLSFGLAGLFRGHVKFLRIRGKTGSAVLFLSSLFLILYISGLSIMNAMLVKEVMGQDFGAKEKAAFLVNGFGQDDYRKGLSAVTYQGLTIYYPADDEETVKEIKNYYPEMKAEADALFGSQRADTLTVVVYDSSETLQSNTYLSDVGGYYKASDDSIHILSSKLKSAWQFEEMFAHEYIHYRTDLFMEANDVPSKTIPQWIYEGVAEAASTWAGYMDIKHNRGMDLSLIETNQQFHQARGGIYNPYLQSYYAVEELLHLHGNGVIANLLLSVKENDFSSAFEKVTGSTMKEFENSYMDRRRRAGSLLEKVAAAQKNDDYLQAEILLKEAVSIAPDSKASESLIHVYIKQQKFNDAIDRLQKNMTDDSAPDQSDMLLLSELLLLENPQLALEYAEKAERQANKRSSSGGHFEKFANALRKINSDDPLEGYIMLFSEDLLGYDEIKNPIYEKVKSSYSGDNRLISLRQ